jgi:predicted alpha/beta-fold hydrolase
MRTFWDFDGRVTAPLHGFTDAEDYYRRASSRYFRRNPHANPDHSGS